jgi:hypothetical protein
VIPEEGWEGIPESRSEEGWRQVYAVPSSSDDDDDSEPILRPIGLIRRSLRPSSETVYGAIPVASSEIQAVIENTETASAEIQAVIERTVGIEPIGRIRNLRPSSEPVYVGAVPAASSEIQFVNVLEHTTAGGNSFRPGSSSFDVLPPAIQQDILKIRSVITRTVINGTLNALPAEVRREVLGIHDIIVNAVSGGDMVQISRMLHVCLQVIDSADLETLSGAAPSDILRDIDREMSRRNLEVIPETPSAESRHNIPVEVPVNQRDLLALPIEIQRDVLKIRTAIQRGISRGILDDVSREEVLEIRHVIEREIPRGNVQMLSWLVAVLRRTMPEDISREFLNGVPRELQRELLQIRDDVDQATSNRTLPQLPEIRPYVVVGVGGTFDSLSADIQWEILQIPHVIGVAVASGTLSALPRELRDDILGILAVLPPAIEGGILETISWVLAVTQRVIPRAISRRVLDGVSREAQREVLQIQRVIYQATSRGNFEALSRRPHAEIQSAVDRAISRGDIGWGQYAGHARLWRWGGNVELDQRADPLYARAVTESIQTMDSAETPKTVVAQIMTDYSEYAKSQVSKFTSDASAFDWAVARRFVPTELLVHVVAFWNRAEKDIGKRERERERESGREIYIKNRLRC